MPGSCCPTSAKNSCDIQNSNLLTPQHPGFDPHTEKEGFICFLALACLWWCRQPVIFISSHFKITKQTHQRAQQLFRSVKQVRTIVMVGVGGTIWRMHALGKSLFASAVAGLAMSGANAKNLECHFYSMFSWSVAEKCNTAWEEKQDQNEWRMHF